MGVPTDISPGRDGADDPDSWDERFNSPGPEYKAPGTGETLENNPGGRKKKIAGGNRFVYLKAEGDDLVHSDGRTAQKAVELIHQCKGLDKPFFLAVGFVRPHVPLVAPKKHFEPHPFEDMVVPPKIPGNFDDIPMNAGNLQGKDISPMFDDPAISVRDAILCSGKGRLYREKEWALLNYGKNGELYDMENDPKQCTNLYHRSDYANVLADLKARLAAKLKTVGDNDLR